MFKLPIVSYKCVISIIGKEISRVSVRLCCIEIALKNLNLQNCIITDTLKFIATF